MAIEINSTEVLTPPLPSATVMVLRDSTDGPEVLMMRRHGNSGVLGGAWVFPGGKLDAHDRAFDADALDQTPEQLLARLGETDLDATTAAALYIAALRETFEECDLLLGQPITAQLSGHVRARLLAADGFAQALHGVGLQPRTLALSPWSRWITPRVPSVTNKRFDTRFFVAQAPDDQQAAHDNHEATDAVWVAPRTGLQRYWDGQIDLAPPQIMTLSHLAHFDSVAALLAAAAARPPARVAPEPFMQNGERVVCYAGDPRHSERQAAWPGPTRLTYRNHRFEPDDGLDAFFS